MEYAAPSAPNIQGLSEFDDRDQPGVPPNSVYSRRTLFRGLAVLGVGSVLGACTSEKDTSILDMQPVPDGSEVPVRWETHDIDAGGYNLAGQEWLLGGVEQRSGGLRVRPAPVTIVNKDGSKDQPILPFNTEHCFNGEAGLQVEATLTLGSRDAKAALLIAETLPLIYDEFQFPGKGVRVTVTEKAGVLEIWDGQHQQPQQIEFTLDQPGSDKNIALRKVNGKVAITVNDQPIHEAAGFADTRLWLGLEAHDDAYNVDSLVVTPVAGGTATIAHTGTLTVDPYTQGLRTLAANKNARCTIGTAVAAAPLLDNTEYAALVGANFSSATTENGLKPQFTQPEEGVFRTSGMQPIIDFARNNNMQLHGHALLPNRSLPKWMRDLPTETSKDKARVRQVMIDHITGVLERFPTLASVDVVNEPLDGEGWRDTLWYRAMGDEFIAIALQAAYDATKETNPDIFLVVNENAMDKEDRRDEERFKILFEKLRGAKKTGMNLAMGFEGHVYELPSHEMSPKNLARRMSLLSKQGIYARVSEMDVTTHQGNDTTPEGLRIQAEQFASIAWTCMEADNCISFTMWGVGGKYVSTAGIDNNGQLTWGSNLPWDRDLKQRPATYRALQDAFR